jgi:hypothetical protein
MVDNLAQAARRQRLIQTAKEKYGVANNVPSILGTAIVACGLSGFVIGVPLHIIRWLAASLSNTPAYAHANVGFGASIFFGALVGAAFCVWMQVADMRDRLAQAQAEADKLDAAEVQAEQDEQNRAAYERAQALEAAIRRKIAADEHKKWEAEAERERVASERAAQLLKLDQSVLHGWAEYQLHVDFLGTTDKAALRNGYARVLHKRLSAAEWTLLQGTQNPTVRAIIGSGSVLG